jgi:bifunctional non-homologous end joining protein LigD
VAFDNSTHPPQPSFERLQSRMHVTGASQIKRLQASTPVVYAIFDLLYLDGKSLMGLPYAERRARLAELELAGRAWRVPEHHVGQGRGLLKATQAQGLEGIVAKRLDARYEPGARNGCWLKIKHTHRQELVIGGWLPGEGRRQNRIGALLMGYFAAGDLRFAGRVGTGFTERTLDDLGRRLARLQTDGNPFTPKPKLPRDAVFVEPRLVAEVEFREWTREGIMRAPSFKGLREDKDPEEVIREDVSEPEDGAAATAPASKASAGVKDALPFDRFEPGRGGAVTVEVDGRELKLSNWDKVLFPAAGFTKGDLITFYARAADAVLPHLHDRALTLKRYPNGVSEGHFYEKQSPSHRPDWVQTAKIKDINYTLCQDKATLVWLANLADIELHTSLSLAGAPERPTMLVFDLDPGPPAGLLECCQVGLVLRGMFGALGLETCVKTSGSKGLQVYVPLNGEIEYEQTKPFARHVAELLEQRMPELVVSRMTKSLRKGRVLVDWSQNDEHKTTACVYSVRALERPGVSTPLSWEEVEACRDAEDPQRLVFSPDEVLDRVAAQGDLFAPVLHVVQELPRV